MNICRNAVCPSREKHWCFMAEHPVSLLVADDNEDICEILREFFSMTESIRICGIAKNGEETLQKIEALNPDVVLLDVIMPKLDGIGVLEQLKKEPPEKMPKIIIASALGMERVTNEALALGVSYYMIKPYNFQEMVKRILMVASPEQKLEARENRTQTIHNRASQRLMELGISTKILGYQYMADAVVRIASSEGSCSMSKEVYAQIASTRNTTPQCVESAIRQAIARAHSADPEAFTRLLPQMEAGRKPSNGKLLTILAEGIKLEMGGMLW